MISRAMQSSKPETRKKKKPDLAMCMKFCNLNMQMIRDKWDEGMCSCYILSKLTGMFLAIDVVARSKGPMTAKTRAKPVIVMSILAEMFLF